VPNKTTSLILKYFVLFLFFSISIILQLNKEGGIIMKNGSAGVTFWVAVAFVVALTMW
jgi:hypothetical protein